MILIAIFGGIIAIVCANNGEWGPMLAVLVVIGLLCLGVHQDKKNARAWLNFRDYWYKGGPRRD